MPLKPIFDKAPLMTMICQPLRAGLVRMESTVLNKLYSLTSLTNEPAALEGVFRLACIVTAKPGEEPVASKIRSLLSTQKEDGSFVLSFKDSVALLRAGWAIYEFEARKPMLDYIARWCAYAVQHWDALMSEDDIWVYSADLLELLENLYRVTGKAAVLTLCERVANQTMGWSSVLNTISSQRPTNKAVDVKELNNGIRNEKGSREGYYTHLYRTNHAESLADGARSTMAKGWYSGSATELNATRNGWDRLYRHHGAICGGLTSDELLEGTSPAAAISTAAIGAWVEALCAAAMVEQAEWAYSAIERMAFNAMPACISNDCFHAFQLVNALSCELEPDSYFAVSEDHEARSLTRLVRGYTALVASAVTATADGANINLYMSGRYAVPVKDELLVFTAKATTKGVSITVHCKQDTEATVRLRIPAWSRNTDITVNGSDNHGEVKNGMFTFDRTWHDGDEIILSFEQTLSVVDAHHQGKYILCGPIVMAMTANQDDWKQALITATLNEGVVKAKVAVVKEWKIKGVQPGDIPVLPETTSEVTEYTLVPYAKTCSRIALFPGRKQA